MANPSTIANAPGASPSGNVLAETAFGLQPLNTVRTVLQFPQGLPINSVDGREFVVRAGILVTTGVSSTYGPSIRLNSGSNTNLTTFASDTAIITPSAPTIATTTSLITISANLSWDVTTGHLNGSYRWGVDATFTAPVVLTAVLTSGVASQPAIQFLITGIFGTTSGSNTAVLKYFELDVV